MSLPDGDRSQVILLGASRFAHAEALPAVPEVRLNVTDLAASFTDGTYGIVPPANCVSFVDDDSLPTLGRRLRAVAVQAKDLLLIYYAGHGLKAGPRHELYLAMYETDPEDPNFGALKYDVLREIVIRSPARVKVIILDCCFSGTALDGELSGAAESLVTQLNVEGCCLLTSSQADKVALVLPGERHTAFTERLLEVLSEGVPTEDEFLTFDAVYRAVEERLTARNLPTPIGRGSRTASSLFLARNRGSSAAVAAACRLRFDQAETLVGEGQWPAALEVLRSVEAEQTRLHGADHEETLRTRRLAAHAVGAAGDPREASHLLQDILELETRSGLGPDNAEHLRTRQYLAVNLGEAGARNDAVAMLRVLLPDRRRLLGPDHEDTLRTQHMLARNVALLGARAEAEALLREIVHSASPGTPAHDWALSDLTDLLEASR
ncbi:caspase family protein [Actinoplanes sp. LDG1-06]|uniref:Caspase family protein n=1 Tax=Paractinoplanes ovalisporus TaxID=2810368 RepID=A0ABS2AFG9_9ACTN|nr:tetratricopeptide repeat protein [Actinoplanes ovalisporus]MBM2618572.1 caspase family protein [Actinoplanes ovalisporus]